ncbi:MAG: glycosyltransferase [Thermoplasmata archaeon]|nr:glycosyltransferase [Thermoplasmata archaeon]
MSDAAHGSAPTRPITVVVPLPPTYRGGTEEYAYELVRRFTQRRPVKVLATIVRYTPERGQIDIGSAQIELVKARELMQRPLVVSRAARRTLREAAGNAAILQLHMPFPGVESPTVKAAQRAGVRTVLTYHMDADLAGASRWPGAGAATWAYRRFSAFPVLEAADAVVSNSMGYAKASPVLSRYLGKMRVIAKGVDVERLGIGRPSGRERPACVKPEWAPEGRKRIVFVGRLVPYKGVRYLLEATQLLKERGVDVSVLIAGRGPLATELEARSRELSLDDRVHFVGFVPDEQIGAFYRFGDVVANPSMGRLESTCTALEEGTACGTPVVGTNLPGTSETVPNDGVRGLLVAERDPVAFSRALERMLSSERPPPPETVRTWDDTAREYLALFDELGMR